MKVQNQLTKSQEQKQEFGTATYECGGQSVNISPSLVRKYLVNGTGAVSDQEVMMFISLCKFQKLNPFLREAHLIKYGSQPATIVVGKEAFTKRAERNPKFAGFEAGVVILEPETYTVVERVGTIVLEGEKLIGGWARVYIKGWEVPLMLTVAFDEYVGRKSNGEINQQWSTKPGTMIRKVALVQALREAFPEELGGMHAPEEVGAAENDLPADVITEEVIEAEVVEQPEAPEQPETSAADALFGK